MFGCDCTAHNGVQTSAGAGAVHITGAGLRNHGQVRPPPTHPPEVLPLSGWARDWRGSGSGRAVPDRGAGLSRGRREKGSVQSWQSIWVAPSRACDFPHSPATISTGRQPVCPIPHGELSTLHQAWPMAGTSEKEVRASPWGLGFWDSWDAL